MKCDKDLRRKKEKTVEPIDWQSRAVEEQNAAWLTREEERWREVGELKLRSWTNS